MLHVPEVLLLMRCECKEI